MSSISGFSVGSGRVDEAVDDFKVSYLFEIYGVYHRTDVFVKTLSNIQTWFNFLTSSFQDTDPFKSKENLFSSSETGKQ